MESVTDATEESPSGEITTGFPVTRLLLAFPRWNRASTGPRPGEVRAKSPRTRVPLVVHPRPYKYTRPGKIESGEESGWSVQKGGIRRRVLPKLLTVASTRPLS